jgi:cullin-4
VFEVFYKNMLSKRLLQRKAASMDAEKSFIGLLKTECGTNFTAKMEGMLKDMDLSNEIVSNYTSWCKDPTREAKQLVQPLSEDTSKCEMNILTNGYWPTIKKSENLLLPEAITVHQKRFIQCVREQSAGTICASAR